VLVNAQADAQGTLINCRDGTPYRRKPEISTGHQQHPPRLSTMRTPAGFLLPDEKLLYVVLDALHVVRIIQFSSTQQNNRATEKQK
jgi:hypothetical protein